MGATVVIMSAAEGHNVGQQTQAYYHGTDREFQPGDRLLPTGVTGVKKVWSESRSDRVYVTPDYDEAKWYANRGVGPSKTKIYEVEPDHSTMQEGGTATAHAVVKRKVHDVSAGMDTHYSKARGLHPWGEDCKMVDSMGRNHCQRPA